MGRIYSNYEEHEFESVKKQKNWVLVHLRFRSIV